MPIGGWWRLQIMDGAISVLNGPLPAGTYTVYFVIDMVMNGSLDMAQAYYDTVKVTVTEPPPPPPSPIIIVEGM